MYSKDQKMSNNTRFPVMGFVNNMPEYQVQSHNQYKNAANSPRSPLPTSPRIFTSLKRDTKQDTGYDSDSSDDTGRIASAQRVGLKIMNPDTDNTDDSENITIVHQIEPVVTPNKSTTEVISADDDNCRKQPLVHETLNNVAPIISNTDQNKVKTTTNSLEDRPALPPHQSIPIVNNNANPSFVNRDSRISTDNSLYRNSTYYYTDRYNEENSNKNSHCLTQPLHELQPNQLRNQTLSPGLTDDNSSITGSTRPMSIQVPGNSTSNNISKYAKVSYHLTNDPTAIKRYREMAEKTNDTTTQLMFAKYLLETANAFYATNDTNKPPVIVGSMWGVSTTTKKSQQPEPFFVVLPPNQLAVECKDGSSDGNKSGSQSISSNPQAMPSVRSGFTATAVSNLGMKQQVSLSDRTVQPNTTNSKHSDHQTFIEPSRIAKRKALEDEGIRWIKKLTKLNVGEACFMLANWMDKEVYGFKKNKSKSLHLHSLAAKANIPESVFAVANHYDNMGEGMDSREILKYYKSSADHGYANAIYAMAFIKFKGKLGTRQSLTEGLSLMYKACTLSSEDFNEPLYVFAQMLTNEYPELDLPCSLLVPYGGNEAAILYYERAAKLNNPLAQAKLGSIYEHGLYGEAMNFAKAFEYYEIAAFNNNPKAMLGLSRLNNRGSHGPGDENENRRLENDVSGWLAATPINEDLSFSWCEKAAKQELPDALSLLGWYYEIGFGTPRDFTKATYYYQLAGNKGDREARSRLTQANKSITKQQHEEISKVTPIPAIKPKPTKASSKKTCFCM